MDTKTPTNGVSIGRIIDVLQIMVMAFVIPWGVWVSNMIYLHAGEIKECKSWRSARPAFMSPADGNLLKLQTKEELRVEITAKLDKIAEDLTAMRLELTKHLATKQP